MKLLLAHLIASTLAIVPMTLATIYHKPMLLGASASAAYLVGFVFGLVRGQAKP